MPQSTTYIGASIKVAGTISAEEDLYIDGEIKGSVCAPGHRVTVGELAYMNAETVARELVVYGAVQGGFADTTGSRSRSVPPSPAISPLRKSSSNPALILKASYLSLNRA